jgi:hypothetical protein
VLLRKDIYGLSQLRAVYIIPTTLPLYIFPEDGRQSILPDFKSWHIEKGYCSSNSTYREQGRLEWKIAEL